MKQETGLTFQVEWVEHGQDATRFMSIWFVKQEDFCGTKEMRSK